MGILSGEEEGEGGGGGWDFSFFPFIYTCSSGCNNKTRILFFMSVISLLIASSNKCNLLSFCFQIFTSLVRRTDFQVIVC